MTVYIYKDWVSTDEELISEKIFDVLASKCDDVAYAENNLDYEWEDNVEEENCTLEEVNDYIKNGYLLLGDVLSGTK